MTNQTEHHAEAHAEAYLDAAIAQVRAIMDGKPFAGVTTLDLVRHWMMSEDNNPNDWERDFAAALDTHRIEGARSTDSEAILRAAEPAAWMYYHPNRECGGCEIWPEHHEYGEGWTETPLYPASAILDAVREAMVQEWLPIESAPKDGTWFLAFEPDGQCNAHYACQYYGEGGEGELLWSSSCGQYVTVPPEPTHWMPLPAAPTPQDPPQ